MGWKLDTTWKGPYTITEVAGKGRYRLRAQSGKELKKLYSGVLLKEYFEPAGSQSDYLLLWRPKRLQMTFKKEVNFLVVKVLIFFMLVVLKVSIYCSNVCNRCIN